MNKLANQSTALSLYSHPLIGQGGPNRITFQFSAENTHLFTPDFNNSQLTTIINFLRSNYSDSNGHLKYHEILNDMNFIQSNGYLPREFLINPYTNGKVWGFLYETLGLTNTSTQSNELLMFWSANIIYLILYTSIKLELDSLDQEAIERLNNQDNQDKKQSIFRLNYLDKNYAILGKLLPSSIRHFLKNPSYRFINRLYTGYDTEFQKLEHGINEIISAQLVITSTTGLKILNTNLTYDFSKGYTGTGLTYLIKSNDILMEYHKLLETFRDLLNRVKPDISESLLLLNSLDCFVEQGELVKDEDKTGNPTYFLPVKYNMNARESFVEVFREFPEGSKYPMKELIHDIKINGTSLTTKSSMELTKILSTVLVSSDFSDELCSKLIKAHKDNQLFLLGHFTAADLSILSDFEEYKSNFDILRKSFTSATKPMRINGLTVYLRDTGHLSDPRTSLVVLGNIYGLSKLELPEGSYSKMREFSNKDPVLFKEYGMRDALIALIHGLALQDFSHKVIDRYSIPVALSSLSREAYLKALTKMGITDYNQLGDYHIADFKRIFTSRGVQELGNLTSALPYFLGLYRGGRNESYAFGMDENFDWSDVDLSGAYPTAMSQLGIPDYSRLIKVNGDFDLNDYLIQNSSTPNWTNTYGAFKVNFTFPPNTIFPNIPMAIGDTATVYPLKGENALVNNYDLVVALNNGCYVELIDGYIIPFLKDTNKVEIKPFLSVLREWALLRKAAKKAGDKGLDLLYKLLANGLYGQICIALNNKRTFDARLGIMRDNIHSRTSNPIIGQAISGFCRALLSDLMNFVNNKGGKVVSCTTDGFLTNILDLHKLEINTPLAMLFKESRAKMTGTPELLEEKDHGRGLISWKTRGQLGIDCSKGIGTTVAATGIQRKNFTPEGFVHFMRECFINKQWEVLYLQQSLRGGNDIWKYGGSVTMKAREQVFRIMHDSRRVIYNPENLDPSTSLLFSLPHSGVDDARFARSLMNFSIPKYEGLQNHIPNFSSLRIVKKGDMLLFCAQMLVRLLKESLDLNTFYQFLHSYGIKRNLRTVRRWFQGQYYPSMVPITVINESFIQGFLSYFNFDASLLHDFWENK